MKIKLTCLQTILSIIGCAALSMLTFAFVWYLELPFDTVDNGEIYFGAVHITLNFIWLILTILFMIIGLVNCDTSEYGSPFYKNGYLEFEIKFMSKKKIIIPILVILVLFGIYSISRPVISGSIDIYNQSVSYQNAYKQKTDEKMGFYDKLWKVYLQKNQIAELNRDVFLEVTKLIMEGRSDGDKVAWKWVQENQQIPYAEFTKFYSDLSNFVFSQREAYFKIEQECMTIANQNNTMLDTFPNNMYNKILGCKKIEFEYSFTSKKTKEVFATGEENIE